MSRYLEFYIRRNEEFIRILSFGSCSKLHNILCAPYGEIKALTETDIANARLEVNEYLAKTQDQIKKIEAMKKSIASFNNDVYEKQCAIAELEKDKEDELEDYDEMIKISHLFDFLEQMIDELQFNGEKENSPDECLYYGVEVGKPTVESIEN